MRTAQTDGSYPFGCFLACVLHELGEQPQAYTERRRSQMGPKVTAGGDLSQRQYRQRSEAGGKLRGTVATDDQGNSIKLVAIVTTLCGEFNRHQETSLVSLIWSA